MKIKQFNLGPKFGGIRLQAANSLVYVTIIMLFNTSIAAIPTLRAIIPWVNLPLLIGGEILLYTLAIVFEHIFVYKSVVSYNTRQSYIPENPVYQDLQQLKDGQVKHNTDIAKIMRHLGIEDD